MITDELQTNVRKTPMTKPVFETNFSDLTLLQRGKVRDIYDLDDKLLLVATDRLSAFDVIMPDPIPDKGKVLFAGPMPTP